MTIKILEQASVSGCSAVRPDGPLSEAEGISCLEGKELELGGGAYEALDPLLRACLKSQIALLYKIWSPVAMPGGSFRRIEGIGKVAEESLPLDWAVFILAEDYASPAGFIAALLPALMSGCENIYIWRQGRRDLPLHPAISAALELLGLEEIYGLDAKECGVTLERLAEHTAPGRSSLVLLGEVRLAESYFATARERGLFHHALPARLKLAALAATDQERLNWLHPGVLIVSDCKDAACDAVIGENASCAGLAPLILAPGQDWFWIWPQLDPAAFRQRRIIISGQPV